jgi:hypothetical protein
MTGHREDIHRILPLCTVCALTSDKNEGVPQAVLQELACAAGGDGVKGRRYTRGGAPRQTGLLVPAGRGGR